MLAEQCHVDILSVEKVFVRLSLLKAFSAFLIRKKNLTKKLVSQLFLLSIILLLKLKERFQQKSFFWFVLSFVQSFSEVFFVNSVASKVNNICNFSKPVNNKVLVYQS